jgi:hypothetical protein
MATLVPGATCASAAECNANASGAMHASSANDTRATTSSSL